MNIGDKEREQKEGEEKIRKKGRRREEEKKRKRRNTGRVGKKPLLSQRDKVTRDRRG